MVVSFPLSQALLSDLLPVTSGLWTPAWQQEYSGLGSDDVMAKDLGPQSWTLDVTTGPVPLADMRLVRTRIMLLGGSLQSFYFCSSEARYPAADATGAVLGGASVKVNSVNADNRRISFKGLPAAYELTAGDFFDVDYGGGRRSLMVLAEGGVASGGGVTAELEVTPTVRTGIIANCDVHFAKPAAKCIIVPGSVRFKEQGAIHGVVSFQIRSTLRQG